MLISDSGMYSDKKCTFCGENKADAMWGGQKEIFVDFLINVILVVSLLGASFISFLWYRSRIYFKK